MAGPFLRRVRLRNYKSIRECDVKLGRFTILVGRNGSGKSNFLDALRFVVEGLETSLDHAIRSRGGIDSVRRRSTGHPHNVTIDLDLDLQDGRTAHYGFELAAQRNGGFIVRRESAEIGSSGNGFEVRNGNVERFPAESSPPAASDRLFLVNASGFPQFRGLYDDLRAMGFYNLNPDAMRSVQSPDSGELLKRDGRNIASVVARLERDQPATKERVREFLQTIASGVDDFCRVQVGPMETVQFSQDVKGSKHPWKFFAVSMSDGTLRALGTLVATMQFVGHERPVRLVGIEEPETALHPSATGALMDALREAAESTQILITTHSPDLLDRCDPDRDTLLAVQADRGTTEIGSIDDAGLSAIQDHLYSAGDLLRMDQLRVALQRDSQAELVFEE